jgi:hypothetical protein
MPPPRAAASQRSSGFIDRVAGMMRGGRGARGVRGSGGDEARTRVAAVAPMRRRGSIRVINEQRLVVTVELGERESWTLPLRWTLRLENGTILQLEVDVQHSTQDGLLEAGQEVRLVFELGGKLPAAAKLLISEGVTVWEIALSR